MIAGACPLIQLDSQKEAFLPLCTVTLVSANKAASTSSIGSFIPFQGRCRFVQANHSHLKRSALLIFSKSTIPSPLNSIGLATSVQATFDLLVSCPQETVSHLI
jgi:hypothetical protein